MCLIRPPSSHQFEPELNIYIPSRETRTWQLYKGASVILVEAYKYIHTTATFKVKKATLQH